MEKFNDRLKLQKTIYLLQSFGVYLGYDFSWYLRGPYCSRLAASGFELQLIYEDIPSEKRKFKNSNAQKKFGKFLKFIKDKSTDDLEIAASLHYQKQICVLSDDKIKDKVTNKLRRFERSRVDSIWEEMKKCNLIQ